MDRRGAHDAGLPERAPVRRMKAELTSCAPASLRTSRHLAARQHLALMQDDEIVARGDLVEQMRRPEHADALFGDELADMAEDIGARLDVEPDGRLVEQQQPRPVQQRARDLDPAHLPAREIADLAAGAVGELDAREHSSARCARVAPADAVQRGVIEQVLHHREIEVERARLEHDAHQPQRLARLAADVMAEDADVAGLDAEQPRDQREQRALAGAVQAEQRGEARRRHGEVDIDQGAARAVGMADAADRQRRRARRCPAGLKRPAASGDRMLCVWCRHGDIVTPQGSSPTWIVLMTFCAATSITETSLETPLVTSRYFSSGVNAMCQTRWPTRRYLVTAWVAASTTAMRLAGPSATKAVLSSLVMPMPTGWIASLRRPGNGERHLAGDGMLDRVDDRHRAADLGGDPELRAVVLELGKARPRIDQHVGDHLARRGVDEMRHVGGLGRVDQDLAVRADRHALGLDADLDVAEPRRACRHRSR